MPVPSAMANAGVLHLSDQSIDTQGQQLRVPVPLPGKLIYALVTPQDQGAAAGGVAAPNSLTEFDLTTGAVTVIGPQQAGWSAYSVVADGSHLAWLETLRGNDSSCVDPSFGCFRWAIWSRDLSNARSRATELAHEDSFVPLRGVPTELRVTGGTACWASSNDSRTWTVWHVPVSGSGVRAVRAGSLPIWVPRCEVVNGAVLAITWDMSGANGKGNLVTVTDTGSTVVVPGAQDFAARGNALLYTTQDPSGVTRELWSTSLTAPKSASPLVTEDDIPAFGWIGTRVWLESASGLLLTAASPTAGQTPLTGNGEVLLQPHANGDTLVWVTQADDHSATIRSATIG